MQLSQCIASILNVFDVRHNLSFTINMTENHVILGSPMNDPRRVISNEETLKGGTCRSCNQTLNVREPRIKVAYPNVIVQYTARTGSPSFYMHPACYETNPVDFWRIGSSAYKETLPIHGFALNPETDVIGYDKYPDLHHCFDKSRSLSLTEQRHLQPETAHKLPQVLPGAEVSEPITGNNACETESAQMMKCNPTDEEVAGETEICGASLSVPETNSSLSVQQSDNLCPRKRRAEYVKCKGSPIPILINDAELEDQRLPRGHDGELSASTEQNWKSLFRVKPQ